MQQLLQIKNLKVGFTVGQQKFLAVDQVNLDIQANETVVLAGESGSGKSITSLAICKLLPVSAKILEGQIIFKERDLVEASEKELTEIRGKSVAYIFQEPSSFLNPVYTVGKQLIEPIILHQHKSFLEAKEIILDLLNEVKISDPKRVFASYPHQLSGGMNQRVFIAMALACRPELLIADEPTTALDVTIEKQIIELLMQLQKKYKYSLLFITHNLSIARKIASRVFVMHKAKLVEANRTQEIFSNPQHFHTKELIAAYEKVGRL